MTETRTLFGGQTSIVPLEITISYLALELIILYHISYSLHFRLKPNILEAHNISVWGFCISITQLSNGLSLHNKFT